MKQLLFSVSLFIAGFVQAQKIPVTTLDLNNLEAETKIPVPFGAVQVMDVRFDQSNVGTISQVKKANDSRVKTVQSLAAFPTSLEHAMPRLLEGLLNFRKESKDTLVLLVKQFRISDRIFNRMNGQYEPELLLRISVSAFGRKNGQLQRLFSVDDLLAQELPTDRVPKEEVMQEYRSEVLLAMLQKLLQQKNWQGTGAAGFELAAVQQGIQKRFQLPLFTDSLQRMGIYKTFREFKQNTPSLLNVKFGMKKDRLVAVTDSTGKPVDLKNYWGISTGAKHYIIFRNEWCELFPSDKSFYFLSYTQLSDLAGQGSFGDYAPQAGLLGGALIKSALNKDHERFFYLNMDDETVYLEEIFGRSSLKSMEKEILK